MKARLIGFLKSLLNKGRIVEKEQCVVCKGSNDFYRINFKVFCSLGCFYEDQVKKEGSNIKVKNSSSTDKVNKSKNGVYKKKSKQKKSKR